MEIEEVEAGLNRVLVARSGIHNYVVASVPCVVLIRRRILKPFLLKTVILRTVL
jgi:hypothetical protein